MPFKYKDYKNKLWKKNEEVVYKANTNCKKIGAAELINCIKNFQKNTTKEKKKITS